MKKFLIVGVVLLTYVITFAQTPEDALRYSWLTASGTARSQAIGNANGAIGGEISTIFSNPANIGFYKTSDMVFTGGINFSRNQGTYLNGKTTDATSSAGFLGTTGFVFAKPSYSGGPIKSSAFGFAINRTADFNGKIVYQNKVSDGASLSRSAMADMFMQKIEAGTDKYGADYKNSNDYIYGPGLAYETYWVDTKNNTLVSSASALAAASGLEQRNEISSSGGITEFAFAGAANINEKVYFGGSIGIPILNYTSNKRYTEQDPSLTNQINQFDYAYFEDDLNTKGVGINLKIGALFKATENFRFGISVQTPTFYSLTDKYSAYAETSLENYPTTDGNNFHKASSNSPLEYDYYLRTPYKVGASFSLLFGNLFDVTKQKGFLSGDVEYVNYSSSKFSNSSKNKTSYTENTYSYLNSDINDAYKGAVNARLGAELKFNTFMVRLGGAYYGNPYNNVNGEKGDVKQLSTGLGYRNKGFFIDLAYVHTFGTDVNAPYRTLSPVPFYNANIKSSNSRVLLTLGVKI
jgi:hypothetical protein